MNFKNKNFKRIISAAALCAVAATTLSGCFGNKDKTADGKIKIVWMNNVAINADSPTEKWLEEKYGVDIETISVTSNYDEKLGAMASGGDIPDVFFVGEPEVWRPLAKQGLIADYDLELVKEYAPDYYKEIMNFDENLFKISRVSEKYYALPRFTDEEYNTSALWRKDWLDAVGITKVPETIEEYEEALVAFREKDPDGNGQKDTYGLTGMGNHMQRFFDFVFGAYGVMPGQWSVSEDGVVSCDALSNGAKQALTTLNRWYEKGAIHPEFVTDNVTTTSEKFLNGVTGVRFATADGFREETTEGKNYYETLKQKSPDGEWVIGPLPSGPEGDRGDWLWGPRSNFVCFGKQVKGDEEKMKKILAILNDTICDEETAVKTYFGDKDVTYQIDGEGIAAYKGDYATMSDKRAEYGIGTFWSMLRPLKSWAVSSVADKYYSKSLTEFMQSSILGKHKDALLRPVLDSATMYSSDLDKIRLVAYSEFITGKRSLDKWDDFVEEYMQKGGEVLLKEAQSYYDENLK